MQNLEEAELEFAEAINKLLPELESKYQKIENYVTSIKCYGKDGSFKQIRVVEDYERRNPKFPTTNRQYQLEGGHRELSRKMESKDPNAWKVEIKCYSNGQHYEIAPVCEEALWSTKGFEKEMRKLFLE